MKWMTRKFWQWPDGIVWRLTEKRTLSSRRRKYKLFISLIKPKPQDKILDVGVAPYSFRGTNFLEQWYPYPENITALTNGSPEKFKDFNKYFPKVKLVFGNGKNLEFPDNHFDIVFSNAVVEHVGGVDEQRRFIQSLIRVGERAFITTPNYWFPVDAHTLIPFAHWLPKGIRFYIYKKMGRSYWADDNHLNLLSAKRFISLFPREYKPKIYRQRIFGITSSLIAVAEK